MLDWKSSLLIAVPVFLGMVHLSVAQEDHAGEPSPDSADETNSSDSGARVVNIDDLRPPPDQLMREAIQLQEGKEPARAAAVFADVLRYYPEIDRKPEILFRLAECYRALGRFPESRQMLDLLRSEFENSDWDLPGRLLAGEMDATEEKWKEARNHFQAAARSDRKEIRVRALYMWVVASMRLDDLKSARPALKELASIETENPHRDLALLKLGQLAVWDLDPVWEKRGLKENEKKRIRDAEDFFKRVLSFTPNPALRAEAAVRAGNLVYRAGQLDDAVAYYEMVRKLEAPEQWRELSHLGLLQSLFSKKDFEGVIRIFNEAKPAFPEGFRAQVLYMAAESYRATQQWKEALRSFELVLKETKDGEALARASLWAKVMIFQTTGEAAVVDEAGKYLAKYPDSEEALRARLIRADAFFRERKMKTAVPMYKDMLKSPRALRDISDEVFRQVLFRCGVGYYSLEQYEDAVPHFSQLLKDRELSSEKRSQSLWLLGQSLLAQGALKDAEAPLLKLVETAPDFKEREELLWKLSYLYANLEMFGDMKTILEKLNQEFHNDGRKGELYQWLAIASDKLGNKGDAFEYWGKARLIDEKEYFSRATRYRIAHALKEEDIEVLSVEVNLYDRWRQDRPQAPALSSEVYEWLGQRFAEVGRSEEAEMAYRKVLATDPSPPQEKRTRLKLARLMTDENKHGAAVREWEIFREKYPEDADRTEVLAPLAEGYLGSADFDNARVIAEQILRQNPEGDNNARGRILLADLAFEQGDYVEAGKLYRAVSVIAMDDAFVPLALSKAEKAFRRAGMETEADEMLLQLNKKFPDFQSGGDSP